MTTNRPLIAVTPLMDYGRDSLWMLPGYMEAIMRAGGTPVMLPLTDDTDILAQCAERFDAFGAADIFLEIVMQPFLGFDDIVPDSSSPATV